MKLPIILAVMFGALPTDACVVCPRSDLALFCCHPHRRHFTGSYRGTPAQRHCCKSGISSSIEPVTAPTRGPHLTASYSWGLIAPSVASWPSSWRLLLMKACLIAFVSLNDVSDEVGNALILRSIDHANTAVSHLQMKNFAPSLLPDRTDVGIICAILVHDAVRAGKLSLGDTQVLGTEIQNLVTLTALENGRCGLHCAVRKAVDSGDGWVAAMLLEARGDLLDMNDAALCQEVLRWCITSEQSPHLTDILGACLESAQST